MRMIYILSLYLLCTYPIYAANCHIEAPACGSKCNVPFDSPSKDHNMNDDLFAVNPIDISVPPNTDNTSSLPGTIVGSHIIELRRSGNIDAIGKLFVDYFYHKRSKRDILDLLNTINIPLKQIEVESICDYLISKGTKDRYYSGVNFGYSLEAHATPETRISLIFLNQDEIEIYKRWSVNDCSPHSKREEFIAGNLEGRLCVWPKRRKIHIGGPRIDYERAKRILLEKEFD